jgi:cbb3-type cytochrome oxidase maturation protein
MDILFLLIPLSALLVLAILGVFGWALWRGQFEDLEHEGERILLEESPVAGLPADNTAPPAASVMPPVEPPQGRSAPDAPLTPRPGVVAVPPQPTLPLDADQAAAEGHREQSRPAQHLY